MQEADYLEALYLVQQIGPKILANTPRCLEDVSLALIVELISIAHRYHGASETYEPILRIGLVSGKVSDQDPAIRRLNELRLIALTEALQAEQNYLSPIVYITSGMIFTPELRLLIEASDPAYDDFKRHWVRVVYHAIHVLFMAPWWILSEGAGAEHATGLRRRLQILDAHKDPGLLPVGFVWG